MKVRYDQVLRMFLQNGGGFFGSGGGSGFIALPFELNVHHPPKAFVIFNYQYSSRAHKQSGRVRGSSPSTQHPRSPQG